LETVFILKFAFFLHLELIRIQEAIAAGEELGRKKKNKKRKR
jgi:hypothetical protein